MEEEFPLAIDSGTELETTLLAPNVLCWTDVNDDNVHILWCAEKVSECLSKPVLAPSLHIETIGCFFGRSAAYYYIEARKGETLAGYSGMFEKALPFEWEPVETKVFMLPSKVLSNLKEVVTAVFTDAQKTSCYREYAEELQSAFLTKLTPEVKKLLGNFYLALQ